MILALLIEVRTFRHHVNRYICIQSKFFGSKYYISLLCLSITHDSPLFEVFVLFLFVLLFISTFTVTRPVWTHSSGDLTTSWGYHLAFLYLLVGTFEHKSNIS